ncbi:MULTISPECIES: hypothetical protein [Klebsiella]|uniref:hypothetical protein n=1 Tax=Klebsiella TaxID=570 RepID=UPI0013E3570D|nr:MULTISPECIES: hypothetical protein [Klebsiella]MDK1910387.1 hypothetical protein [Klebsiella sp. K4-136]MDK1915596.1 hypothetical protein [Klebsiella sp. K4-130]MDK1931471.1 hypothetical protein [Klebsiella sp. K4-50]MDK1994635.1 hypothetical protein [Klebsiella sp. K5-175]
MKYFTVEQVVEALKTGAARRHQIYDNFAQARYRGFTERAALLMEWSPPISCATVGR